MIFQKDTEKNWEKINPVLPENELVIVTEIGRSRLNAFKLGDGKTKFKELMLVGKAKIGQVLVDTFVEELDG